MAKRKITDKTSKTETEDQVDANGVTDPKEVAGDVLSDLEAAPEAPDAGDKVADDVLSLEEPKSDDVTLSDDALDHDSVAATEKGDDHLSEDEAEALLIDAETVEGHAADPEPIEAPAPVPLAPEVIRETTIERKGGFVPMLAGGVVAAALGYGAAAYVSQDVWPFAATGNSFEDDTRAALTEQGGVVSDLGARLATLEATEAPSVDLTPIEDQIAAVQSTASDLATRLDATTARIEEMTARVDVLERQPLEQAVSPEAIAAYERALADLQADVEAQRAEVVQMAQEAVAAEENAEEQAKLAASRAALATITAALESGTGYADAVGVLAANGVEVPEVLAAAAEAGLPTMAGLMTSFPDTARAALSAARSVETETAEGTGRIATFFANQLGARSVAPREGDSPDAVLSRAEAAVRGGDLGAALDELTALPEVALGAVSDWQARAKTRLEAQTAADGLVQQLLQE
ncbi:MAG: COG4223 family protein [Marivita sp.]|uniref:COG4223 family protein n=1 Tax=Marivita sp. TaxID=2003365 RepID=UPI003EF5E1EA